ncbi:hypothetical protein BXZ70DRAFT_1003147 [Cristinia sonorae]|uniref:Uncharacterized protein n=1 Tax=Cristinia sonorae TaxID=1940300 RepID=A0A8K0XUI2_9AGAR|nr:hypothetical protein BXZ70DRAFT_1003147 [Cristinia sonorae]
MPTTTPSLPFELIEAIAGNITGDNAASTTFRAMAEVCTTWASTGQSRLFRTIRRRVSRIARLVEVLYHDEGRRHIARVFGYTQTLWIWGHGAEDAQSAVELIPMEIIPLLLSKLPNLRTLDLGRFPFRKAALARRPPMIVDVLNDGSAIAEHHAARGHGQFVLDRVRVDYTDYEESSFLHFVAFLNLFAEISALEVCKAAFRDDFFGGEPRETIESVAATRGAEVVSVGVTIRTLTLQDLEWITGDVAVLSLLVRNPSAVAALTSLRLTGMQSYQFAQFEVLCDLMPHLACVLTELEFGISEEAGTPRWPLKWDETVPRLSSVLSLQSLTLHIHAGDVWATSMANNNRLWTRVVSLLTHLPPHVTHIHLVISGRLQDFITQFRACDLEGPGNRLLDDFLIGMERLQSVIVDMTFNSFNSVFVVDPQVMVQQALRKTSLKGILFIR